MESYHQLTNTVSQYLVVRSNDTWKIHILHYIFAKLGKQKCVTKLEKAKL